MTDPGAAASSSTAIAIEPEVELVVTEGNYLLLDRPEWCAVRAELDELWFLDVPDTVRRPRAVAAARRTARRPPRQRRGWRASTTPTRLWSSPPGRGPTA